MRKNSSIKRSWTSASLYFFCITFIAVWWGFSFGELEKPLLPIPQKMEKPRLDSSLTRTELQQALQGDFTLMGRLVLRWDVEAQHTEAPRLPAEQVLRAHYLSEAIPLQTKGKPLKILPQTYATAGILLALTTPQSLVALPRGLREQKTIYPHSLTSQIPLDIDQYTTEKLFRAPPDLAFVSDHYTHPATFAALANQGIPVKASPYCETVQDVLQEIETVGDLIGQQSEAELLRIFIEAAFLKIDRLSKPQPETLFLSYYDHFYFPKESCITGALVKRAGLAIPPSVPTDVKEYLIRKDPKKLVISAPSHYDLLPLLQKDPGYATLRAIQNGEVYFVNDELMQTPTQAAVLAYFDLVEAVHL